MDREPGAALEEAATVATGLESPSAALLLRSGTRALVVLAVLTVMVLIVHLTPLRRLLAEGHEIVVALRRLGWIAPAVFVPAVGILVAMGCPRLLLCPIGGLAFGFLPGLLWTQIGTLAGSYATFLFVRWGGRPFVLHRWPALERYAARVEKHGLVGVLLVRQVPVSGFIVNSLLGLTHVGHAAFLGGTAIGILPEAIPMTLVGASGAEESLRTALATLLTVMVLVLALSLALAWYLRSRRRARQANP